MYLKEKSGYLQRKVLNQNFFQEIKKSLEQIQKERRFQGSLTEKIRERAELLWHQDKSRSDLDNWLLAEKQVQKEELEKFKKIGEQQKEINRCLRKYYRHRNQMELY